MKMDYYYFDSRKSMTYIGYMHFFYNFSTTQKLAA